MTDGPSCGCRLLVSTDVLRSSCDGKPHLLSASAAVTLLLGKQASGEASAKSPFSKACGKAGISPLQQQGSLLGRSWGPGNLSH